MISESAVLLKIHRERGVYRRELRTQFVQGIIHGLGLAVALVRETGKDARNVRDAYRGRLNRWSAAKFHHAIEAGLAYLKRGDRARGIRILETAIEHEGEPTYGHKTRPSQNGVS